eukprot:12518501-Prorocentrum_lima.AAC.1
MSLSAFLAEQRRRHKATHKSSEEATGTNHMVERMAMSMERGVDDWRRSIALCGHTWLPH